MALSGVAGIVAALLVSGTALAGPLVFGLIATVAPRTVTAAWQPFLDDLSTDLGLTVSPGVFDEYAGVVWAMAAGKVQIAWLGNKSAIEAVDRAGGEVGLIALDQDGRAHYEAVLLARKDSGITNVEDVFARAGALVYGDGDVNSTSGHLIPGYFLFDARGTSPRAVFKRVTQQNHEGNFLAVAQGRADVATGNSVDLERMRLLHPDLYDNVRVVWTSPPIPMDPIVWRTDLPEALKERIRRFFLGYGKPAPGKSPERLIREKAILRGMTRSGFAASDNGQLAFARMLELRRERARLLAAAEEASPVARERLAAVEAKLAALREQLPDGR